MSGKVKRVAAMLKAIHAQEDAQAAKGKVHQVAATLREIRLARAAEIVEAGIDETLTYCAMPAEHWRVFAPMTLWNGRCAKSDEEPVRWGAPRGYSSGCRQTRRLQQTVGVVSG